MKRSLRELSSPTIGGTGPALRVADISVRLGDHLVLDSVELEVERGAWVALIGPNGAGKTTVLRASSALCPLTAGRIELLGTDVTTLTPSKRALSMAYVPQDPLIPAGITVEDYVLLGRNPHIGFFSVEGPHDMEVVSRVLHRLELDEFRARPVETLSGGERRRVVLARALAQEAPVLLLDEPTSGLDLGHAQEVLDLVDRLRVDSRITVLSAIHDLTMASQYAESLVMLDQGRVVARGTPSEVLTERRLALHYRARVTITAAPNGARGVVVSPARRRRD
ncbi:MAG: ABC transporter ATP-binding protein [Actinobacteria bacterium]|nr:ABC transporter ATP-binding protein [Actinomycetota bacterium]